MKHFAFLILLAACTASKKSTSFALNGTWAPAKQEMGGKEIPSAAFEKQTLTLRDSTYTTVAESIDKGIVRYKDGKMDIYGKEGVNNGRHFTAIYKLENGQLSICYNLKGDSYPETFETKGKPLFFMSVFRKKM
jgi:uncharacterized protein (TIGR03067 family)